jgi:cell wall-associated NlpC family hydrolase
VITGAQIAAAAQSWVGVPFLHQGRNRQGVDCAGLIVAVLREVGWFHPDFRDYPRYGRAPQVALREAVERIGQPTATPAPGVVCLIRWPRERMASHIGWLTGGTLVHANGQARRVVEHGYRGNWVRDTVALYRLTGVDYGDE